MDLDSSHGTGASTSAEAGLTMAWLELNGQTRFPVQASCSIGRSASNQAVLPGEKTSRRHAIIHEHAAKNFWLTDLGSSNGTYLNGRRITQATRLYDEDRIGIGEHSLLFRHPSGRVRPPADRTLTELTVREIRSVSCWLLLVDLESSTRLAQSLAPQEVPVVMGRWLDGCKEIVEQNDGSINKYLGDGFFAYWFDMDGTAAAIAQALLQLKQLQVQRQPHFRLVLHYGRVSAGGTATLGEESLMGAEVNFVFRMEKLAGHLKTRRLLSQPAAVRLTNQLTASFMGRHKLSGFEGEFEFLDF
jgi:class 3 adenylate cyclase